MTHWYGWLALALTLLEAVSAGLRMVGRAYRGPTTGLESRIDWGCFVFAAWVLCAVALVAA